MAKTWRPDRRIGGTDESLNYFVTRLHKLVTHCEFNKFDNEAATRQRIIKGCHSAGFRMKILKETYTLDNLLTMARSEARDTSHAILMETRRVWMVEQVHRMARNSSRHDKP
ncbi:hypothetical protein NDU88_007080 [Pleurodeles waltl]|uniref:Uncharacterized protein n=1 Tax=Pleurodeles waltl TaxID=8319 RepID=A0AAV7PT35_PLEWA|nr:hypothetical protein NDU88_007080 [Pleurodeles waltl]